MHARRVRGVSAIEYLVVIVLVAIGGVAVNKRLGTNFKCAVSTAVSRFSGGDAPACGGEGGGAPLPAANGDPGGSSACPHGSCMAKGNCFVAGTLVLTESGPQPIETIEAGTAVLSRDPESGANEWKPVIRTIHSLSKALVRLTVDGADGDAEALELTPSHPLHVEGRGWVAAGELVPGRDLLLAADGERLPVKSALLLSLTEPVYNLEVADDHSYFVGRHGVWAHNANGTQPSAEQQQQWEAQLDGLLDMRSDQQPADWSEQVAALEARLRDLELSQKPKKTLTKDEQAEKKQLDAQVARLDQLDDNEKKLNDEIARLEKDKPKNWEETVKQLQKKIEVQEASRDLLLKDMVNHLNAKSGPLLEWIHQDEIAQLEKEIAKTQAQRDATNGKTPQHVVDALDEKLAALKESLAEAQACPPKGCTKAPVLDGTAFDPDFKKKAKKAGKMPVVDGWIYNGFKAASKGTTTALTIVDYSGVGTVGSVIARPIVNAATGAITTAWDGVRYARHGKALEGQLDQLLAHRNQTPSDAEHAIDRAVTNFAIQQMSQQIDKYHEAVRNGVPNTAMSMIPFVDPHIMNPLKFYKGGKQGYEKIKGGFGNEIAKTSKFFDKNNEGDIRDSSVEKKTAATVLLDAAYLNDDKGAQKVMGILFGDDVANKFGQEWPKVHAVEQQIPPAAKSSTKRVNPFVDEQLKMDNFVKKYQGQKPAAVTAQNDPNGVVLHYTENGLGAGTRPPRYVLEPDPSVASMDDGKSPFPPDYNKTFALKNYDRTELGNGIGKDNVGPKGKWSSAMNDVKGVFGKSTSYPDETMLKTVADKLSASPTPRNDISLPSSDGASTNDGASISAAPTTSDAPSTSNAPPAEPCE